MKATETRFALSSVKGLSRDTEHVIIGVDASVACWSTTGGQIAIGGGAVANHGAWLAWRRWFQVDTRSKDRTSMVAELYGACRAARAIGSSKRVVLVTDNTAVARNLPGILAGGPTPSWVPSWLTLPMPYSETDIEVVWSGRQHALISGANEIARLMRYGRRSKGNLLAGQFEELASGAVAELYGCAALDGAA